MAGNTVEEHSTSGDLPSGRRRPCSEITEAGARNERWPPHLSAFHTVDRIVFAALAAVFVAARVAAVRNILGFPIASPDADTLRAPLGGLPYSVLSITGQSPSRRVAFEDDERACSPLRRTCASGRRRHATAHPRE